MLKLPIWKLQPGIEAPDFDLPSTGGGAGKGENPGRVRLADFRGKKPVVLAFYPAAFTRTCTAQLPAFEEDLAEFERRGAQLLGISTDYTASNEAWAKSLGGFSFPLLSDHWPHGHVAAQYGVLRGDGRAERAVFVIDREGMIAYAQVTEISKQPPLEPILAALDRLR
jgi:peroxiredoxin